MSFETFARTYFLQTIQDGSFRPRRHRTLMKRIEDVQFTSFADIMKENKSVLQKYLKTQKNTFRSPVTEKKICSRFWIP